MFRSEYPRPHFDRSSAWSILNGTWDFCADPTGKATREGLSDWQDIAVPFAWETRASGIARCWLETGWYRRRFSVPEAWQGQRIILHFGAVSNEAIVYVNGTEVARHVGAYTPFEADITEALGEGEAELVVRAHNPSDKLAIPHGKQRSMPRDDFDGVCFTPSSGIWQPVWLEPRPNTHIARFDLRPSAGLDALDATIHVTNGDEAEVTIDFLDKKTTAKAVDGIARLRLDIVEPRLWTPADPHLYYVTASLASGDRVTSYSGLRSMRIEGKRVLFNGGDFFMRAVLDQGYWPEGGLTAPSDADFVRDIELAAALGYNTIRKHIKFEDPRWLYHCDRLGMLVWAEPPSPGRFSKASTEAFESLIDPMVARDGNHPAICFWGLYNEEWGLDWDTLESPSKRAAMERAYDQLKALDDSRPIVENSGWTHTRTDIVDWHYYTDDIATWARKVDGIFNGSDNSFPVKLGPDFVVEKLIALPGFAAGDLPNMNSEYGGGYTSVERGWHLRWQTQEMRRHDAARGYVYTELCDVEHENAGLLFYDRSGKDLGGVVPAHVNADTLIIFDLVPEGPGRDVVSATGRVETPLRLSHHGNVPLSGQIAIVWGAHMQSEHSAEWTVVSDVRVEPFKVSLSTDIAAEMPKDWQSGRLHVALLADGIPVANAFLDVVKG